eukprot:scaffold64_cov248-Pinguiococcus_pyrenoidosus.AAC.9
MTLNDRWSEEFTVSEATEGVAGQLRSGVYAAGFGRRRGGTARRRSERPTSLRRRPFLRCVSGRLRDIPHRESFF